MQKATKIIHIICIALEAMFVGIFFLFLFVMTGVADSFKESLKEGIEANGQTATSELIDRLYSFYLGWIIACVIIALIGLGLVIATVVLLQPPTLRKKTLITLGVLEIIFVGPLPGIFAIVCGAKQGV